MDPFGDEAFIRTAANYGLGGNGGGGDGGAGSRSTSINTGTESPFPMLAHKLRRMENFDFSAVPPSPPPPSLYFDNNSSISSRSSVAEPLDLNVVQLYYQICKVNKTR